jgi:hypothetical protein
MLLGSRCKKTSCKHVGKIDARRQKHAGREGKSVNKIYELEKTASLLHNRELTFFD